MTLGSRVSLPWALQARPQLFVLTGTKGSGKDTFKYLARGLEPGAVASIAIADWFKKALSQATGFDLQSFYDERKEMPYRQPITMGDIRYNLGQVLYDVPRVPYYLKEHGLGYDRVSTTLGDNVHSRRVVKSNRELMEWFGFEFFHACFGSDELHCEITNRQILTDLEKNPHCRYFIITDARTHFESSWFAKVWREDYQAKVQTVYIHTDPNLYTPSDTGSGIEKAVANFPSGWFDRIIWNSKLSMDDYCRDVQDVLLGRSSFKAP